MRRNKYQLENRRGERQHQLIKDCTTHENFVTMYDRVYFAMVDEEVATLLYKSEYYFINRAGRRVKTDEEADIHQIKHHISHPQYVMFGYEVGTYTNNMYDENNGGQRYTSIKAMKTNLLSSKALGSFTLMGLTAATSDPVLCI